eukprot:CAMPEP_0169092468 /NCGR_PEP_ID=MMETSP1015-20121227/16919_1 /TAXON_ID=342587 /ORGANISM="Karlodinium micrum, Strain CCMP2283" /LENGTH=249 /DNA_ID=CAMNT_0009153043 /DNA_START=3 /DNA_END=752 /DNA_ORIENTATION=+
MTLNCYTSPERPSWAYRCGCFFDVVNKTDRQILITGLCAGSHGGDREATLYACTEGGSAGNEENPAAWKILWQGSLKQRSSTPLNLHVVLQLPKHATQGLLLVSKEYAVYHSTTEDPVEDDNIMLVPGMRSTEHHGDKDPFDGAGHDRNMRSTHAGSITYMFGQSYIVMCEATETDADENARITLRNMAGSELGVVNIQVSEDASKLREKVGDILSGQMKASLQLELMTPEGALLKNGQSIAEGFADGK